MIMTSVVKHTNTKINMNNTAVLVIDVQFGLISTPPEAYRWQEVRQNINALLNSARKHDFPVIFIQHDSAIGTTVEPFSAGWQLHPDLHRRDGDLVIRKTASDAFHETQLRSSLEKLQIKRLLVTGYATELCVDTIRCAGVFLGRLCRQYRRSGAINFDANPELATRDVAVQSDGVPWEIN